MLHESLRTALPSLCACTALAFFGASAQAQVDLAANRPASASSELQPASLAVDAAAASRWESTHGVSPSWLRVDLGTSYALTEVVIDWEAANAADYQIQGSTDDVNWTPLATRSAGAFGNRTDTVPVSGTCRYVRMFGTKLSVGNAWGYSIFSFRVYGTALQPPARLQAEDYVAAFDTTTGNLGGQYRTGDVDIQRTTDLQGGFNVGWTAAGEWLEYNVATSGGQYRIDSRVASVPGAATLQLAFDGQPTAAAVTIASTGGWQTWTTVASPPVCIAAGSHTLRATLRNGGLNLNWLQLVKIADSCITAPPDFGPNVTIFDPSMPSASIQSTVNSVFARQETNQFGTERYAFLFKPGSYNVDVNMGFYTHVMGLGISPEDVRIAGDVHIEAEWLGNSGNPRGNATQNFWRAAENLWVTPSDGRMNWAAAQAVPFRRMHVTGDLFLSTYYGWASGGYIADSKVGRIFGQSQQQWFTRNSELTSFFEILWNMTFVGVINAPVNSFPNPAATTIAQTPAVREKPFLYLDGAGTYNVFVPALRTNTQGTSWSSGTTAGTSLPISQFYIVRNDNGSAAAINAALAQGKDLLFTPGVYHLNDSLRITRDNTVVLGIGLATLIPDNGVIAMQVADVDGVKIAGLLFDAGPVLSPALLEVGPAGSARNHAANPTSLFDIFMRVGGTGTVGKTAVSMKIHSNHVIGDHFWIWRADHGDNVAWTINTSDTGLIVNGNDVTLYGLFVEHFQKHQVIWNGNGGRTYFFQNEIPYDVPTQAEWMNGNSKGYAAYKVADSVTTHEAWGLGSYCFFQTNPSVQLDRSFEAPNRALVRFHNLTTISLGGVGTINHVINDIGNPANAASYWQQLLSYP
jgi:DUF5010 C-terminal domain/F5/8 type C domain